MKTLNKLFAALVLTLCLVVVTCFMCKASTKVEIYYTVNAATVGTSHIVKATYIKNGYRLDRKINRPGVTIWVFVKSL